MGPCSPPLGGNSLAPPSASAISFSSCARSVGFSPQTSAIQRPRSAAGRSRAASRRESRRGKSSGSINALGLPSFLQLGTQPGPGPHPTPLRRAQREPQRFRRLFLAQAPEVAAFEDAGQLPVALAQAAERTVQVEQTFGVGVASQAALVELEGEGAPTALVSQLAPWPGSRAPGASRRPSPP